MITNLKAPMGAKPRLSDVPEASDVHGHASGNVAKIWRDITR